MKKINCFNSNILAFQTNIIDGNLATHTGDDLKNVFENRQRLQETLQKNFQKNSPKNILSEPLWLNQNHGIQVTDSQHFDSHSDAIISSEKNKILAILTADCLPILLVGKLQIAAIHAGWRGLAGGIVENTFAHFKESPADCRVFLGVCIQPCCFEVGIDVLKAFKGFESAFSTVNQNFFLNLQEVAALKLFKIGVLKENIFKETTCTACDSRFFSYRQTKTVGRQATLICQT